MLPHFKIYIYIFKYFIYLFLERREGREKDRDRNSNVKKKKKRNSNVWLLLVFPQLGTWPSAHACALTGNETSDPLVYRSALSPLSHTSQGSYPILKIRKLWYRETN